jgi:flagellin-specific chaperone FliS
VHFFQRTKQKLDKEEGEGLIASWERVYKFIMNKIVKEKTWEVEPVMKEPSKMLNELGKAVDLDEIMNEDQNQQNRHNGWNAVTTV